MVFNMIRKYLFYILLIIIYLLFLAKDTLFGLIPDPKFTVCNKDSYYEQVYNELLESLNIDLPQYNITYSKVITRDIYNFFDKITITKPKNINYQKGSLVVNNQGLIGIINKTKKNSSEVILLTNNKTSLSVKINNSYGILSAKDSKLYVKNIKSNQKINIGDKIYTSGLTNTPENIYIGEVKNIILDNLELEYILEVSSPVDFYNLKYVGVLS